jgi:hypothetical protein
MDVIQAGVGIKFSLGISREAFCIGGVQRPPTPPSPFGFRGYQCGYLIESTSHKHVGARAGLDSRK